MRKVVIAVTLTASILALTACGSSKEVVVKTAAGNITQEQFYDKLRERDGEQVLQEMVTMKILEDKYEVDEKDIDQQVNDAKEQLGEQFDMWLMQEGYGDEEAFRELVRTSLLYDEAVYEDVEITDEEINEQYERMKTEIEAQHILVLDEEQAKDIKKQLDDGGDFAKLAKEHSTDVGSAEEGGKLGYFASGQMMPEFEEAAYTMDIDTISDPVQTAEGFHIIKVTDKREIEEDVGPLEDHKVAIVNKLKTTKVDPTEAQAKLEKLIKDAKVDIKIKDYEDLFKNEG